MSHDQLQALLIRESLVDEEQVREAIELTRGQACTWIELLILADLLDEDALCRSVADAARVQRSEVRQLTAVTPTVVACVTGDLAIEHRVMPLGVDADGYLLVAMVDPVDAAAIAEVGFFSGRPLLREIAPASAIARALHHYYDAHTVLWPRTAPPVHGSWQRPRDMEALG